MRRQRISSVRFQSLKEMVDPGQSVGDGQAVVAGWILPEVGLRQFEESSRGAKSVFLQMHERPGQLNQPLEKGAIRSVPVRQPKFFQHVVSFVKESPIETFKITEIPRVEIAAATILDQRGDFRALPAQGVFALLSRSDLGPDSSAGISRATSRLNDAG